LGVLQNALLEFVRVVEAKEQVVAGTVHHLTLEALEAGRKKIYEAKVWVKPWLNFKELQEFVHTGDATSFTASDLGAKKGICPPLKSDRRSVVRSFVLLGFVLACSCRMSQKINTYLSCFDR
jgi:hypothetical protein